MDFVIVAGISGMDKARFISNFVKKAGIQKDTLVIRFEDALVNPARKAPSTNPPTTITSFLKESSTTRKIDTIEKTFSWLIENVKMPKATKRILLDIHLTYYHRSEFFPPLNPSSFAGWIDSIDRHANVKIVTLIDDIFNTWHVLSRREAEYPGTKLTLREILAWRSLEVLQSESLGYSLNAPAPRSKQVQTYLVSVRHPPSTFRNIVIEKVPVVVYLSFPISKTRDNAKMVDDINRFRSKMHRIGSKLGVAVLDPVTIDELILTRASKGLRATVLGGRWQLGHSTLVPAGPQVLDIPCAEIQDARVSIKHQVRSRDLKLVETSNLLAVYRPCFPEPSTGVRAEIDHAVSVGQDMCIYSPPEDHVALSENPFDESLQLIGDKDSFYKTIQSKLVGIKNKSRGPVR